MNIDLIQDTSITLSKLKNQKGIYHLFIKIKGVFSDTIDVNISNLGNVNYKKKLINNNEPLYEGDWYSDSVKIYFWEFKNQHKNLKIIYKFEDLD